MYPMTLLTQSYKLASHGLSIRLCKATKIHNVQVAFITGKALRKDRPLRPAPYPYLDKKFSLWDGVFDPILDRFDDNTRMIVVEGPPAAGKSKFAQQLADELEMLYIPPPTFDDIYKMERYNFDRRSMDSYLPMNLQTCDIERFLKDPYNINVAYFQIQHYMLKYFYYIWAMLHLLSTGQGVVMDRCFYSDFIFMKAMMRSGYVSRPAYDFHRDMYRESHHLLWRPHLVIYLDTPVDVVKQRIQQRAIPYEVNSKALTDKYLTDIDTMYRTEYLIEVTKHSLCLSYDGSKEICMEDVVEDIQSLDFTCSKLQHWTFYAPNLIKEQRYLLHHCSHWMMNSCSISRFDVPELLISGQELELFDQLTNNQVELMYREGWNLYLDKGLWWKTKTEGVFERFRKFIPQFQRADKTMAATA